MLALRRLEDAERDHNRIYAVIRGVGSSSDGRSKSVYAPRPDTAEDLLRMFDFTAPEGWVSDDVRWLVDGEGEAHWYSAGDRLPVGVQAFPGHKRNDMVLWVESHRAVVAGDTLADFGEGPQINPRWLVKGVSREQVVDGLRPLLTLPVEHLLETHGGPFDRAALERALS